jgi:cytochrome c-type protein NapB
MNGDAALRVFMAVVVGVALIGFVRGTSTVTEPSGELASSGSSSSSAAAAAESVGAARTYREMREHPQGEGSGWAVDLSALRAQGPGRTDPVSLAGTDKAADLAARAGRRAFDGAPPRIPHAIRQDAAPECLACHEEGLRFRGLLATPMSHSALTSCTQCHVVEAAPMPGGADLEADPRAVQSLFVGLPSPEAGPRAWAVAPPQVPHSTWMRERCESCHGVNGRQALRSSHPERESCEQCHATSAALSQRPGLPR